MTQASYARPEMLASTGWLAENLDDPGIRVVDCDEFEAVSPGAYQERRGHPRPPLRQAPRLRLPHPSSTRWSPSSDVMKELMEDMGIGDDTLVVAYDNSGSLYSTRFWWVLSYYGHTNVKVLDGGWKKWVDEGQAAVHRPAS